MNNPIGIFDSGLGGLTVLKQIKKILPNEDIVYLGDTARVPYGTRSKETVVRFSKEDTEFLISKNVKAIVIACNTASAYAFKELENFVDVPIFDVISAAVKKAVEISDVKKIAVIGTKGTIASDSYQKGIKSLCKECDVIAKACPLFVPSIEEGEIEGEIIRLLAKRYFSDIKSYNFDVLIMGCTHYPIIEDIIKEEMDRSMKMIDPGKETAYSVKNYLSKNDLLSEQKGAEYQYYLTDMSPGFNKVAEKFLDEKLNNVVKVTLD